jgi:hypothetical protein
MVVTVALGDDRHEGLALGKSAGVEREARCFRVATDELAAGAPRDRGGSDAHGTTLAAEYRLRG